MSFLDKLFQSKKPYEIEVERYVQDYINSINGIIKKSDDLLKAFGLPVPQRQTDFSYQVECPPPTSTAISITLVYPRFTVPAHVSVRFRREQHFTCVGTEEQMDELLKEIDDDDYQLHNVIRYHLPANELKVFWTTLPPYKLYREFDQKTINASVHTEATDKTVGKLEGQFYLPTFTDYTEDLKATCAWTADEIQRYEQRLRTFMTLSDWFLHWQSAGGKSTYRRLIESAAFLVPDELWELLPPGEFDNGPTSMTYPAEYHCAKIIPDQPVKAALTRQFFENLAELQGAFVFALDAADNSISFNICYAPEDALLVEQQLALHFPNFSVVRQERLEINYDLQSKNLVPNYFYKKIKAISSFHIDPYRQICEVLSGILDNSQEARFEVWCQPFSAEATRAIIAWLNGDYNRSSRFFDDDYPRKSWYKDISKLFEDKLPLWWINIVLRTNNLENQNVIDKLETALKQYELGEQSLVETNETGNLANLDELVSLAHFPTADLGCDRLELATMKTKLPPPLYTTGNTQLGVSEARGKRQAVYLPEEVRDRHVYLVGKSGTGKSTLLETITRADIEAGRGVAVIDPHGDMIRHLMESMPEHRLRDCIYFSPKHSPLSLEILAAETDAEIDLLADDLITMFRRTSESWGDKMQAILQMTFQTLLRVPDSSFTDITPLLTDKAYRARALSQINHPQLAGFWENRFDVRQAEPILIRMDRLTTSGALRSVLTQHKNSLNFYDVIRERKIFLADISKGDLGESTSHLLGSIIVSQIQLAAMRQAQLPEEKRIPFSLFVDEVQNFTTGAFSTILSEARKYKLRLTIAHQFVSQLPVDIQKAVFGNVGTLVFFSMSPDDLGAARYELGTYEPQDVANLPKYNALCRPSTAARDTFSFATLAPIKEIQKESAVQKRDAIINYTQERFAPLPEPVDEQQPQIKDEKIETVTLPEPVIKKAEPVSLPPQKNEISDRGNERHRYLQTLVKRIGERKGFLATIEKAVFDGIGKIDVALESETLKIACEITVTNTIDYEMQNINKCLAAGYSPVIVVSPDEEHLLKLKQKAKDSFSDSELAKIYFLMPEAVADFLESVGGKDALAEDKTKGFKVSIEYKEQPQTAETTRVKTVRDMLRQVFDRENRDE